MGGTAARRARRHRPAWRGGRAVVALLGGLLLAGWGAGCAARGRRITIVTDPPDAELRVNGQNVGPGPVTQEFRFDDNQTYNVLAARRGYREQVFTITRDYNRDRLVLALPPRTRRLTIEVLPVPARVLVDGKPLGEGPTSSITADLEFRFVGAVGPTTGPAAGGGGTGGGGGASEWVPHAVTAERAGYRKAQQAVRWEDQTNRYLLVLEQMAKPVRIVTDPPGAEVFVGGESRGPSPVTIDRFVVPVDKAGRWLPQPIRAEKLGYQPADGQVSWDDEKSEYVLKLGVPSKVVRVVTDPPGAAVVLGGKELERTAAGASAGLLTFPPVDDRGTPGTYKGTVSKAGDDGRWESQPIEIGWDGGKEEYSVALRQTAMRVPLVRPAFVRETDRWRVKAEQLSTWAATDVGEPDGRKPMRITILPKGPQVGELAVSPDGQQVAFELLTAGDDGALWSEIRTANADGTGGGRVLAGRGEGRRGLDLMPSWSPDGTRVLFSSDRGRQHVPHVWWVNPDGSAGPEQLTAGDATELWPSMDSLPRPRLFYESLADGRAEQRLFRVSVAPMPKADATGNAPGGNPGNQPAGPPAELAKAGRQPRIGPAADRVAFTVADARTGKRDVYVTSDQGERPVNLTNSPDVDDFDPAWSADGAKLAFVSDRPPADKAGKPVDYNVWVMDVARPDAAAPVTTNGSWDDSPGWGPTGKVIFFRSNRGGEWAVWRVEVRP